VRAVSRRVRERGHGLGGATFSTRPLAEAGVKRVSLGSSLARAAVGGFLMRAARRSQDKGTFDFAPRRIAYRDINALFER
jgi:2-methylisocitrate lyase-like PEP mutase family enzyme